MYSKPSWVSGNWRSLCSARMSVPSQFCQTTVPWTVVQWMIVLWRSREYLEVYIAFQASCKQIKVFLEMRLYSSQVYFPVFIRKHNTLSVKLCVWLSWADNTNNESCSTAYSFINKCHFFPVAVYAGCFQDSAGSPIMSDIVGTLISMTPATCAAGCRSQFPGDTFMGMQSGNICHCSDSMPPADKRVNTTHMLTQCNVIALVPIKGMNVAVWNYRLMHFCKEKKKMCFHLYHHQNYHLVFFSR